jgi:hypothetical protein
LPARQTAVPAAVSSPVPTPVPTERARAKGRHCAVVRLHLACGVGGRSSGLLRVAGYPRGASWASGRNGAGCSGSRGTLPGPALFLGGHTRFAALSIGTVRCSAGNWSPSGTGHKHAGVTGNHNYHTGFAHARCRARRIRYSCQLRVPEPLNDSLWCMRSAPVSAVLRALEICLHCNRSDEDGLGTSVTAG